jgi:ribosome-associated heat shock protein Hsp15
VFGFSGNTQKVERQEGSGAETQRVDKWLWVARFFKTRALATEAVDGGKVQVDGQRVKPARAVRPGNRVRIRRGEVEVEVAVRGLATQRRPYAEACRLYEETEESRAARERAAAERALAPQRPRGIGRPTKRDRRAIERVRGLSPFPGTARGDSVETSGKGGGKGDRPLFPVPGTADGKDR